MIRSALFYGTLGTLRAILILVLCFAILAGLSACGAPDAGRVIDKKFTAAHTVEYTYMVCYSYNAQGLCTLQMPHTGTDHVPDKWRMMLRACEDSAEGKCRDGWVEVSQAIYDATELNTWYDTKSDG